MPNQAQSPNKKGKIKKLVRWAVKCIEKGGKNEASDEEGKKVYVVIWNIIYRNCTISYFISG